MKCPRCQHDNAPGVKSRAEGGPRPAATCPACVPSNPPSRKACARRWLLALSAALLALLAAPLAAEAQQPVRAHRIGYLAATGAPAAAHLVEAFRQGLRDLGHVEGKNIVIEYRWADGRYERLPDLAAELVRLKVDVILAVVQPAALAARGATSTIPIVMAASLDPVGAGLVASLARPGGNVTGLTSSVGPEIAGKHLELLTAAVPGTSRVAILWNPAHPAYPALVREAGGAARSLGAQLQVLEARSPDEFDGGFTAMVRERAGALLLLGGDPMFFLHRSRLVDLATRNRLPTMCGIREYVEAGCLMAYATNTRDLWRRAATYVDRILKGARPGDLPVEQPTKFDLVINMKAARALGLTIPPALPARADQVIE